MIERPGVEFPKAKWTRAVLAITPFVLAPAVAAPAAAQEIPEGLPESANIPDVDVFDGDYVIVGVGAMSAPSYDGSDSSRVIPGAGATGEIGGIGFTIRGPSLSLDLLGDELGKNVGVRFGPQIRLRSNRNGKIGDAVVARLGELDRVVEGGFRVGLSFDDVFSKADGLSVGVSTRWDISGKGSGMVVTPSASYLLPLSRAQAVGALFSMRFVDRKYADYNYSITPEGAAASGLPVFRARGGLQEVSVGLGTGRDLNGDFLDGGFMIGGGVMYSRLFGSAAKTPITSIRGSRDQWIVGSGIAYTF